MKNLLILCFLLATCHSFAQVHQYYDDNNVAISQDVYLRKLKSAKKFDLTVTQGNVIVHNMVDREEHGTLPVPFMRVLRADLKASTGKTIDSTHLLVIEYYPGPDPCNTSGTTDKKWLKNKEQELGEQLKKLSKPVSRFSIYNKKEGLERYKGVKIWYPDVRRRVHNTFFPVAFPCGSFVVIHPDGRYHAYFGEYMNEQVTKAAEALIGQ
jgi:hypothetical protein